MKQIRRIVTSPAFQRLACKRGVSACFGWLAGISWPRPWMDRLVISFAAAFGADLDESEMDWRHYRTFNDFFGRKLKEGVRNFEGSISSPADGLLTAGGHFERGQLFQVKGKDYALATLLGEEPLFAEGSFASLYLSLGDYHRVHLPFDATLRSIRHIPGTLYSLGPETLARIPGVYCRNERVVLEGLCDQGPFYLILVGAIVVGKIAMSLPGCENLPFSRKFPLDLQRSKGDEVGCFRMGSSVLLVLESNILDELTASPDQHFKTGNALC